MQRGDDLPFPRAVACRHAEPQGFAFKDGANAHDVGDVLALLI
jgi:hypothetical protein